MIILNTPLDEKVIKKLNIGDEVQLNGTVFTARDMAHRYLLKNNFSRIKKSIIYHCGPIVKSDQVIAAGPTTSSRFNIYTPELIRKYQIRAIIGKGGMDNRVKKSLKGNAIYLSAIGGVGALYADKIKVVNVYKNCFGMPDAIWEFEIKDFLAIVSIDLKGNDLYSKIYDKSKQIYLKKIKYSIY